MANASRSSARKSKEILPRSRQQRTWPAGDCAQGPSKNGAASLVLTPVFRNTSWFTLSISLVHLQCIVPLSAGCETRDMLKRRRAHGDKRMNMAAHRCGRRNARHGDRAAHWRRRNTGEAPASRVLGCGRPWRHHHSRFEMRPRSDLGSPRTREPIDGQTES